MDTTKEGVKAYLDDAASKLKCEWHTQEAHKLAVGLFWLDMMGVMDAKERGECLKQWQAASSGGFGSNASQLNQKLGHKGRGERSKELWSQF